MSVLVSSAGPARDASLDRSPSERREAAFWDEAARSIHEDDLRIVREPDGPDGAMRLALLDPRPGKRILDVGCGVGLWASLMAGRGAEVWAVDISPESCATARRCAEINGVQDRVHVRVASAYELPFEDGFFDAVHGHNIVHHLDPSPFGAELARVLRPGGIAVFSENSANNRLLMWARDRLCGRFGIPKWSSDDEYPLTQPRVAEFGQRFENLSVYYPEFLFAGLLNAKVFGYRNKAANWILGGFDRFVARRLRWAHKYSYRQLIACVR